MTLLDIDAMRSQAELLAQTLSLHDVDEPWRDFLERKVPALLDALAAAEAERDAARAVIEAARSDEAVERVARALHNQECNEPWELYLEKWPGVCDEYRDDARAAIAALLPTEQEDPK